MSLRVCLTTIGVDETQKRSEKLDRGVKWEVPTFPITSISITTGKFPHSAGVLSLLCASNEAKLD